MNFPSVFKMLRLSAFLAFAAAFATQSHAQSAKAPIALEPAEPSELHTQPLLPGEASFAHAPENFRSFGSAKAGDPVQAERLTLRFDAPVKLGAIASSKDFPIEPGGSCAESHLYAAGERCTLLVRFTPQGPGRRLGRLTIDYAGAAKPFYVGLGGNGYAPVASFTPGVITTVPGSFPAGKGLLSGAQALAVDGGDSLYIADTGNNEIRYLTSEGVFYNLSAGSTLSGPAGIAVDSLGEVYFSQPNSFALYEINFAGALRLISGTNLTFCTVTSPCILTNTDVDQPAQMSIDTNDQVFTTDGNTGAGFFHAQGPSDYIQLLDPYTFEDSLTGPSGFAVDANDTVYSYLKLAGCQIFAQTVPNMEEQNYISQKVAGVRTCGFSGDGGQARNAQINFPVTQIAFDIAGNLYFTDGGNQRVRRIDATTGIINTIAGNGTAGYTGDGGAATAAALSAPTGVAVDSQGQVYIASGAAATGAAQVIRKIGPNGFLAFGNQLKTTPSATKTVSLANTGNSELDFTAVSIAGANAADFSIDPTVTSCKIGAGGYLSAGQSCKVGLIFKPSAGGQRVASLLFADNTSTNLDTVQLNGLGTLPAPTVKITAPLAGSSVVSGTVFPFTVSVTSATAPAPTGTVKIVVNGAVVSSATALSNGTASVNLTAPAAVGTLALGVIYNGDTNYAPFGPISETVTVTAANKPASTVTVKATTAPATTCQPVTFSAAVASRATAMPTGKVQLIEGATVLATATVNQGTATLTVPKLTAGAHSLKATYSGDSTHAASTSAALTETVKAGGTCSAARNLPVGSANAAIAQ